MAGWANSSTPLFRRIFVTGGTGFLGQRVCRELVSRGVEVHASHHRSSPSIPELDIHWHGLDVADGSAVSSLMGHLKPEALVHLAWNVGGDYQSSEQNEQWVAWSLKVAHEFVNAGGRHILMAGSCAEYDWSVPVLSESSPCIPMSRYGEAKLSLSRQVLAFADRGVSVVWPRLFFLFGQGERSDRVIPRLINDISLDRAIDWIDPDLRRDYLDADAAAAAIVHLICSGAGGIVNVASGSAPSVRELALIVATALAKDPPAMAPLTYAGIRPAEIRADVRRLHQLGWLPSQPVELALMMLARSYDPGS
ncbi:MAG: NAD-dependent epimerase/dehydratase family protein [Acidimicrobiales bacterium]